MLAGEIFDTEPLTVGQSVNSFAALKIAMEGYGVVRHKARFCKSEDGKRAGCPSVREWTRVILRAIMAEMRVFAGHGDSGHNRCTVCSARECNHINLYFFFVRYAVLFVACFLLTALAFPVLFHASILCSLIFALFLYYYRQ